MNSNHHVDEVVGEIIKDNGHFSVRDLFSENKYILAQQTQEPSELGSIIHGKISSNICYPIATFASANSIQASLYLIAEKYRLNPLFSSEIKQEVDEILNNPGLDDPALKNLEHLAFCTIDDADTRDLDQALYIEKNNAGYCVYYALADAAYYVRPETCLFNEALKRGSSYYLPGLMIPMLPRALSEGLISLNEQVLRRAMVFELHLDSTGICINTRILHAKIKSQAKLSFEHVQSFLDSPSDHSINNPSLGESLKLLEEVGELRLQLADERNIARYRRHEVNVKLGKNGCRFTLLDDMRNDVERYNEQLSLLCNVEGARFLKKNDTDDDSMHPIYRVHPHPPKTQIIAFEKLVQALVQIHNLDSSLWSWQANTTKSLAHYLKALPSTGPHGRISQAIHRQAVMTNVRSSFSKEAGKHHGVGADVYARFSAPMREIVGIFLHKEVAEKIATASPLLSSEKDEILQQAIIRIANQSKSVQKKISQQGNLLVLNQLFEDDMRFNIEQRPKHKGTVIGLDKNKIYVLLDLPKIEVKVYIKHLEPELGLKLSTDDNQVAIYSTNKNKALVKLGDCLSVYVKEKKLRLNLWILLLA